MTGPMNLLPFRHHGNGTSYVKGCRCEECRDERSAYMRGRRYQLKLMAHRPSDYETPADQIRGTLEHFMSFVEETASCWYWLGSISGDGYGKYFPSSGRGKKSFGAHAMSYLFYVGPIPDGMEIDHVCHNADLSCTVWDDCLHHGCVNPEHLEAVTHAENMRRRFARERRRLERIGT